MLNLYFLSKRIIALIIMLLKQKVLQRQKPKGKDEKRSVENFQKKKRMFIWKLIRLKLVKNNEISCQG